MPPRNTPTPQTTIPASLAIPDTGSSHSTHPTVPCPDCRAEGCWQLGVLSWHCGACNYAEPSEHPIVKAEREARAQQRIAHLQHEGM